MTEEMLLDRMSQMIRLGFVNARQPEKMRVKVTLPDTTGSQLITDWLPVLCPRACGNMEFDLPDVGDQVLCLFLAYGLEQGFVIGSMYGRQTPPVASGDKWHRKFSDGAYLEYDRASHTLTADIPGTASIKARQSITLEAPIIYLRGTLQNTAQDGSPGKSVFSGGMEVMNGGINAMDGDIVASGVSLASHTTEGVQPGSGTSSHPTGGSVESPGTAAQTLPGFGTAAYIAAIAKGFLAAKNEVKSLPESADKEAAEIILCVPKIARAVAEREKAQGNLDEAQGYLYLADFVERWISKKIVMPENGIYSEEIYDPEPSFVDWEWASKYPRFNEAIKKFETDLKSSNFIDEFTERLERDGYLKNQTTYFNYIPKDLNNKAAWKEWEKAYAQFVVIKGNFWSYLLYGADGLLASMGTFTVRAIPKGEVHLLPGGGHRVRITEIAVYLYDKFNFSGGAPLGWWNCQEGKFFPQEITGGTYLDNGCFRTFRKDTGYGGNFIVLSTPHLVEDFRGAEYDTSK